MKIYQFVFAWLVGLFVTGCSTFNPSPEYLAALRAEAPLPKITLDHDTLVYGENGDEPIMKLRAGVYYPDRTFGGGYIFIQEKPFVDIPSREFFSGKSTGEYRGVVGGIYWREGESYPKSVCFYQSEFVPTILNARDLDLIVKAQKN